MNSKIHSAAVLGLALYAGGFLLPQPVSAFNSLFSGAIVVKSYVVFKGNNIYIDSYDSSDPSYSTNGQYDPTKAKCNGDIASRGGWIDVANANIYGTVHLGPTGSLSIGPSGIITGGVTNDMNLAMPDVLVPFTSAIQPTSETIGGTNYECVMTNGNYMLSSLNGSVYVYAGATATLYVTGNASFSSVTLQPGAVLKVYVGGPSANVANVNNGGNPCNSQLWGLSTLTNLTLSGNALFVGVIYAPEASMTLSGGGTNLEGVIVVNSLEVIGHFNFHYDENLARVMPGPPILSSAGITNGNQFQFVVTGVSGFSYAVLASTNLTDWISVITNVSPFEFLDADVADFPQRFYRAVYLP